MSLKARLAQAERKSGINDLDDGLVVTIKTFATPDGSPKPKAAIIYSGPLFGTWVYPRDGEDFDALEARARRIMHGLEAIDCTGPEAEAEAIEAVGPRKRTHPQ